MKFKKGHKLNLKHGMCKTSTYRCWALMKNRCYNKNGRDYKDYGGRGIKVFEEWLGVNGFENFYKEMGDKPKNKSIDRIDNNGNYKSNNCKWSTPKEQANNTRKNHFIFYKDKVQTIAQWAIELNIPYNTLWNRVNRYNKITKNI